MSSMDLTRDWLHTVTRPYSSRERLVPEVIDVLTSRRTLAVKTDAFTFDSGQTSLLVLLHGTLPISFRGATYHIPVNIWLPHDYPRSPPLAYVVPTRDMAVRKGREVEPGGRVKEEVVDAWWLSWQDKSVEVLLKQLVTVFSAVPPVYSKPATQQPSPQPTQGSSYNAAQPAQPPPPPARPMESLPQYHPPASNSSSGYVPTHVRQSSTGQGYNSPPRSPATDVQPPVPARPLHGPPFRQGSLPPGSPVRDGTPPVPHRPHIHAQGGPSSGPASPSGGPAPPPRPLSVHSQPPQPVFQYATNPVQPQHVATGSNGTHMSGQGSLPQHSHYHQQPPQQLPQSHPVPAVPISVVTPPIRATPAQPAVRTRPMDLMSGADEGDETMSGNTNPAGSPPPLPPSKPPPPSTRHLHSILLPHLQASLPPLLHQLHSSKTHLMERKDDLESGEPAIKDEMARLQAVKKVCDSTGRKMEEVVQAGSARVADLEQRGETSVDEVVCGISIVHNQLIDLVAEDNAIEDTIYHVTRALDAERIDMDRFLKSIRSLAREQYMKRALIERILQGMGQKQW